MHKPNRKQLRAMYLRAWKTWCNGQPKFMRAIDKVVGAMGKKQAMAAMQQWENGKP